MEISADLIDQLHTLGADPEDGDALVQQLNTLCATVQRAVPSCLAVSVVLTRPNGELTFSALTGPDGPPPVLASLAVPLDNAEPGGVLQLQAGAAGAFRLLADGLAGLRGPGQSPIEVDRHLDWPPSPATGSLAAGLADHRAVDQATGVLIGCGLQPEAARDELESRARGASTTLAAAARLLLDTLPGQSPGVGASGTP